jgi:hypothetical protein
MTNLIYPSLHILRDGFWPPNPHEWGDKRRGTQRSPICSPLRSPRLRGLGGQSALALCAARHASCPERPLPFPKGRGKGSSGDRGEGCASEARGKKRGARGNLPRLACALLVCAVLLGTAKIAQADHPEVYVTPADREVVLAKIAQAPWAKDGFAALKARIDPLVEKTKTDPKYLSSRLMMNWTTHSTTPIVDKSRLVGGEGRAPVPTPRFAGARDWATDYSRPANIDDWKPYNDQDGKVYLLNNKTQRMEWVDPSQTGRTMEAINSQILGYAADAAFVYWLTGEEKYARFAAEILWTYMEGFYYVTPPKPVTPGDGMRKIIGVTSFEVIHEDIVKPISLSYDFLYSYLQKQGKDVKIIQTGLKRFADRVIAGGGRDGNWNLNQAVMITHAGLALEDNSAYADGKGRPYYVNVVLNADLPNQKGLTQVMEEGFDKESALWPEAAGYGFGSATQMVELGFLLSSDTAGQKLLGNPLLPRSLLNQGEMLYPNGLSNGVGDTTNTRMSAGALESLIAYARSSGDTTLEARLTPYLQREIASGSYDRRSRSDIYALTRYVPDLKPVAAAPGASRSFFFPGLNILMQRNLAEGGKDVAHSLAAAMYGTNGGHIHQNGLSIELFGAGYILGADPGRGASYWTSDHRGYYVTPVAHNTVVVNGISSYNENTDPNKQMIVASAEPTSQKTALSPNVGWAQGTFRYSSPQAEQSRTLALIRTGPQSGFYFDVFRSRAQTEANSFHDYFYHNMGQSLTIVKADGGILPLTTSTTFSTQPGLMKAYGYLKNEKSGTQSGDICATFTMSLPDSTQPAMNLWMPEQSGRTLFTVEAPANNTIRDGLPSEVRSLLMPTLVVRQKGEAWNRPFVGVYEPFLTSEGARIQQVRTVKTAMAPTLSATIVEGKDNGASYRVLLFQDAAPSSVRKTREAEFQGEFGTVIEQKGMIRELYLGKGQRLSMGGITVQSTNNQPISVSLRRDGNGWQYSSDGPVRITLSNGRTLSRPAGMDIVLP